MRKSLPLILGAIFLTVSASAQPWSKTTKELSVASAVTTAGASSTSGVDTAGATSVMFHVSSAASAISVAFQQSIDGSTWYTPVTVTTATVAGEMWLCPAARNARFYVNSKAGDGALAGYIAFRGGPATDACHRLETYGGTTSVGGTGTLTIASGKSAAINASLTLTGTDSTTMTFPTTSATIARTDAANTFTGTQTVGQLTDSGLTITRVPYASTAGLLIDNAAFKFTTSGGILDVTAIRPSGLTATRVPYAGTNGLLGDDAAFTFTTGTGVLTATKFSGAFDGSSVTASSLTATRIPFAGTAGLLGDDAAFTFTAVGGILDATAFRASGLTATRIPFLGAAGLLTDKSTFTFTTATDTVTAGSFATTNIGAVSSPHFLSIDGAGGPPTVADIGAASCGTTAASIAGKDQAATITVGATGGTACRVSFGTAWSVNVPACVASQNGTSTITAVVPSLTNLDITGTFVAGDKLAFICLGY